jgi:hypothetical protein
MDWPMSPPRGASVGWPASACRSERADFAEQLGGHRQVFANIVGQRQEAGPIAVETLRRATLSARRNALTSALITAS